MHTKAAATVGLLLLAQPLWACGPSNPVELALFIAIILFVKLLPVLLVGLVLWTLSKIWTAATHKEPLRGRVTVLSGQALGI